MDLAFRINTTRLKEDEIAIFWLGQAGFVIKDSADRVIAVDPYLTDCVARVEGAAFKRLSPKLIASHELEPDLLIATHDHLDHFDIDAVPIMMSGAKTRLLGSLTVANKCAAMGIVGTRLIGMKPGDEIAFEGITVKALFADHGKLAPDALGILLTVGKIKIYFAGDTAYSPEIIATAKGLSPDIAIVPINGQYGNLNSAEAAQLVKDTGAPMAIPCHFWTFVIHKGEPQDFQEEMKKHAPGCEVKFLYQGEMFKYQASGIMTN